MHALKDAGRRGDEHSLGETELVDDGLLLLAGQLALLGAAGQAADDDAGQTDQDAEQDRRAGGGPRDAFELTAKQGRHDRSKRGAVAQRHRHAQGDAEVAHGQAESQAANPPEDAENIGPEQGWRRGLREDSEQLRTLEQGECPWGDDPAKDTADEPVRLPRPAP